MRKYVTVLGSSGSIGESALDVLSNSEELAVYGLSVYNSISVLEKQVEKFAPAAVAVCDVEAAEEFEKIIERKGFETKLYKGEEGLALLAGEEKADIVLNGVVGNTGIKPTLAAIDAGKAIALANKEALVSAGSLIIERAAKKNVLIIPVDSEHSAIFQCLRGYSSEQVDRLVLTASGGAFRGISRSEIKEMKAREALKHPTWQMGAKITIDSATLMNKGLEVIEAFWLFGIDAAKIDVIVHPQSVIHSMVEFIDGSVLAQMGTADMRIPIHYALNYPKRTPNSFPKLDLLKQSSLTFEKPDYEAFPCLKLAYSALSKGGTTPCILNEVNQELVGLYLKDKIKFYDISEIVGEAIEAHTPVFEYTPDDLDNAISWARDFVAERLKNSQRR